MKKSTYDKLSPLGKRRAHIMFVVDGLILSAIAFAGGVAAANAVGLIILSLGWG